MKLTVLIGIITLFLSCNNNDKNAALLKDTRISLRSDTVNVVRLTDTLVIYESTCRGCAYEGSTHFAVTDSMNIIQLDKVITTDNSSPDMAGGSISKDLVLVPVKTGTTTIRLYKFWSQQTSAKDSLNFKLYTIKVLN